MYAYHKADPLFLKKKNTRDLFLLQQNTDSRKNEIIFAIYVIGHDQLYS